METTSTAKTLEELAVKALFQLEETVMKGELHKLWSNSTYVNRCSEIAKCEKPECPAFHEKDIRCWHVTGTYCCLLGNKVEENVTNKWDQCRSCEVFRSAVETPEKRINELVNNIVFALKCFDPASVRNITIKKNFHKLADHYGFTAREKEIALLLLDRLSRKEIAKRLSISLETVKMHYKNIYKKVGVNSKDKITSVLHEYCLTHFAV